MTGDEQKIIFQCPLCGVELRATFLAEPVRLEDLLEGGTHKGHRELRSEDFEEEPHDADREDELLAVTLYTDLPVPRDMQGLPAREAFMSPFILTTQLCGEATEDLMESLGGVRMMREHVLPGIRRAASLLATNNLDRIEAALAAVPGADLSEIEEYHPVFRLGRLLDLVYLPALRAASTKGGSRRRTHGRLDRMRAQRRRRISGAAE